MSQSFSPSELIWFSRGEGGNNKIEVVEKNKEKNIQFLFLKIEDNFFIIFIFKK